MPLPKAQTNWTARIAVLLICGMTIGLVIPITWLLRALHAPELVLYPVLTIWAVIVILSALWMIAVWAPVRGKKIAERVLMSPWWF